MAEAVVDWRRSQHWLGILFTLIALFAWTASAFLMSSIFADKTYLKPFLVTYLTCGFSTLLLIPTCISYYRIWRQGEHVSTPTSGHIYQSIPANDDDPGLSGPPLPSSMHLRDHLSNLVRTALIMCFSWTFGNYLNATSFSFTSVASSTIMTSTCSFHVLVMGAIFGVERVTRRKFAGVILSILGVAAISILDALGASDTNRGDFPTKSTSEMAFGDVMAFISAVISAANTILIKQRIPHSTPSDMAVFFGLVGLFNLVVLWPAFPLLHYSGIETFHLPTSTRVWAVLLTNSFVCLLGNYAWAYAVVLTSPTVVTVGLTLSIPLSLVGQSILHAQFAGFMYWIAAAGVICGFLLVEGEVSKPAAGPEAPVAVHDGTSGQDGVQDGSP